MRMMDLKIFSFCFLIIAITGEEYNWRGDLVTTDTPPVTNATESFKCPEGFHCVDMTSFKSLEYTYHEVAYPEIGKIHDEEMDICDEPNLQPTFEYPKRKYNPETYVYMMPKTMVFGDSLTIIATLKKNATRFQIFLINRGFEGLDFGNMPLDLAVDIGPGESNDNVSLGYHSGLLRTTVSDEINTRKLIVGDRLVVMLSFRRHASLEHHFRIEIFLNGKSLNAVEYLGSLADVDFLHVSGDMVKVDHLDFKLVQPHFITS